MLSIPVVSIVVFLTILIPSIAIGYFRGWKSSLFISIAVLALMGGFTAFAVSTYDSIWWTVFKGMFLESHHGGISANGMNALKDLAEPTVVGIILMIATPISYGLAVTLHIPFKDKLKRSLYPKVQQNENKPEEFKLTKTKATTQRVLGATISGTTGLLMASTVVAGVQSIVEPTSKNSFLTDISKSLSKVYSFGQGGYDTAYQLAYEYIPNTVSPIVQKAFNALANIDSNSLATLDSDLSYFKTVDGQRDVRRLAQEGEAFVAILKALDQNPDAKFQLWNQAPSATDGIDSTYFINLENTISNIHLGLNLNDDAVDAIVNYLDSKMGSFETTLDSEGVIIQPGSTWYIQWKNADNAISTAKTELSNLNKHLNDLTTARSQQINERNSLDRELQRRISRRNTLDDQSPQHNGEVKNAFDELDNKNTLFNDAETNFNNYNVGIFMPAQTRDENLRTTRDNENSQLQTAITNRQNAQATLDALKQQSSDAKSDKTTFTNEYNTLVTTTIPKLNQDISNLRASIQNENDAKALAESDKQTKESARTTKQNELQSLTSQHTLVTSSLNTAKQDLTSLQQQLLTATDQTTPTRDEVNAQIITKQNEIKGYESTKKALESQISTLNNEISALNNQILVLEGKITNHITNIQNLNGQLNQKINQLTDAENRRDNLNNVIIPNLTSTINKLDNIDIPNAQTTLTDCISTQNTKQGDYDNALNAYNNYHNSDFLPKQTENNRLSGLMESARRAKEAAQTKYDQLHQELGDLMDGISNDKSIAYTQKQLDDKEAQIVQTEHEIAQTNLDIKNKEQQIFDLENDPLAGEVYLRNLRDLNKNIYQQNIDRYNELIRQLLRS